MTTETTESINVRLHKAVDALCKEIRASTHSAYDILGKELDRKPILVMRASYVSRNVCQQETLERVEQLLRETE